MIFLIDLDGTLIDSDHLHYEAWARVLNETPEEIERIIKTIGMEKYLECSNFQKLKNIKFQEMNKVQNINFIENADKFIDFIDENDINHVVVTHTDGYIVDFFKDRVPKLKTLKNWIVREDYDKPKPDPECYKLALKLYGKGDEHVVGFENSQHGFKSLSHVTSNMIKINKTTNYLDVIKTVKQRHLIGIKGSLMFLG
jgi:HAD superfamily hydrolase (TIGR01509 family)